VLLLVGGAAAAQRAPDVPPRTLLSGVAVDAAGRPLPRVRIDVVSADSAAATVLTGERGEFAMPVTPSPLTVKATKAGFASMVVRLTAEQTRALETPLRIEMPRGAVISGRFLTSRGEVPTIPITVRRLNATAAPSPPVNRARLAVDTIVGFTPDVTTSEFMLAADDRGEFRIGGLPAGRYALEPLGRQELANAGIDGNRVVVDLQAGAEAAGIELVVSDQVRPLVATPPSAAGTGIVRGRVTTTSGEPIVGADVAVRRDAALGGATASTDVFGRYAAIGLAPGSYTVTVTKNGYVRARYGGASEDLPPLPLPLDDGEVLDGIDLVMPRAAAIGGAVIDEYGEPVQDAAVQVLRVSRTPSGGVAARAGAYARRSDDRGYFRIAGLTPGSYILMASMLSETGAAPAGVRLAYAPSYYPGTPDFAGATPLEIRPEEELPGLTLLLRRVPVVRVSGFAATSQGRPMTGTVRLTPRPLGEIALEPRVIHPERDGSFAFADVPSGHYLLQALSVPGGGAAPEFATATLVVGDRPPDPLMLRTSPGAALSGRFVLKGAAAGQPLWGYSMSAVALDGGVTPSSSSTVSGAVADGREFTLSPLAGATRLRFSSPDENWFLDSIVIQGTDAADVPFEFPLTGALTDAEVVFSRTAAAVTGAAADERGVPARDYAAIVFPVDRSRWFDGSRWLKMARAASDGSFRIGGLPPGDYWIAAVARVAGTPAGGPWQAPEFLEVLSASAVRAALAPSQTHAVALRVVERGK
jgi:hypothetical protein